MATSSINIKASSGNATLHNHRVFDVAYAIKNESVNEYFTIASISKTRQDIYDDYKEFHGRKLNTKATPIREAVVNLNAEHTMKDLQELSNVLEQRFGIKTLDISIHRDEGHHDLETKEEKINHHAHLVFSWYNKETHTSIKLDKKDMQEMQTIVAKTLGMGRGQENSKSVRLDHREYKRAMQEVAIATKELKQENTQLKYDFREMQKKITSLEALTTEQKKELHSLNSQAKNTPELESKNIKIQELELKIQDLTATAAVAGKEIQELKTAGNSYYADLVAIYETLPASAKKEVDSKEKSTQQAKEVSKQAISALQATKPLKAENDTLKERLSVLRADMSVLSGSLLNSQGQVQTIEKHIEAQIEPTFAPQKSLKDRFYGFIKELKETIKSQASEILNLKDQVQSLLKQNQEYKELVAVQVQEIANPKQNPKTLSYEDKDFIFAKINDIKWKLYQGNKDGSYTKDDMRQELKKDVYEKFNISTKIQPQELYDICQSKVLTKEDLQKANQGKGQSSGYDLSR